MPYSFYNQRRRTSLSFKSTAGRARTTIEQPGRETLDFNYSDQLVTF